MHPCKYLFIEQNFLYGSNVKWEVEMEISQLWGGRGD